MNMEDHIPISLNVNNSTFLDVSYNLEVKSFSVYNVYNVRLIEAQTHSNTRNIMSTKTRVWPGHVTKMTAVRVFAPRIAVRRWEWEWGRSASLAGWTTGINIKYWLRHFHSQIIIIVVAIKFKIYFYMKRCRNTFQPDMIDLFSYGILLDFKKKRK